MEYSVIKVEDPKLVGLLDLLNNKLREHHADWESQVIRGYQIRHVTSFLTTPDGKMGFVIDLRQKVDEFGNTLGSPTLQFVFTDMHIGGKRGLISLSENQKSFISGNNNLGESEISSWKKGAVIEPSHLEVKSFVDEEKPSEEDIDNALTALKDATWDGKLYENCFELIRASSGYNRLVEVSI